MQARELFSQTRQWNMFVYINCWGDMSDRVIENKPVTNDFLHDKLMFLILSCTFHGAHLWLFIFRLLLHSSFSFFFLNLLQNQIYCLRGGCMDRSNILLLVTSKSNKGFSIEFIHQSLVFHVLSYFIWTRFR